MEQAAQTHAYPLWCRVRALLCLSHEDTLQDQVRRTVATLPIKIPGEQGQGSDASSLETLRCTLWLKRHFHLERPSPAIVAGLLAREAQDGGFGEPPNVLDTNAAISVLALCDRAPTPQTATFLRLMAVPGFGFRLTARSLSPRLDIVCAGVAACASLRLPAPYAQDCIDFLLGCQTGSGGFAQSEGALPNITLTHQAIEALGILAQ